MHKSCEEERKGGYPSLEDNRGSRLERMASEFQIFKTSREALFNQAGQVSKTSAAKAKTQIVWDYNKQASQIIRNLLE